MRIRLLSFTLKYRVRSVMFSSLFYFLLFLFGLIYLCHYFILWTHYEHYEYSTICLCLCRTAHTVDALYCLKKTHSFNVHTDTFLTYIYCKCSIFILISLKINTKCKLTNLFSTTFMNLLIPFCNSHVYKK